ncbi:MAG: CDP-alcohol phosphatidyltransferase family protein [Bacteroidetes bacterium]|nr:CDP-alcohol phosphatidyltransferase family protein [Bacteroidota bacterium]
MIKKHIPNAITCGNLLCGCFAILFTSSYRLEAAFYLLVIAAVLDFFDGFTARLLKVSSPIGKDLDSLADMVTFGVLPGFIMYKMIALSILNYNLDLAIDVFSLFRIGEPQLEELSKIDITNMAVLFIAFIAFIIPVFSAIRLAKFNNDTRQSDSFIGLPTPANGLLIASLGFILMNQLHGYSGHPVNSIIFNPYFLAFLSCLLSFLLVAELPLIALKFKNFGWADNKMRFILIGLTVVILAVFQFVGIPLVIILYILLSIVNNIFFKKKV